MPVPADMATVGDLFNDPASRRVELTKLHGLEVSTVFFGADYQCGEGPPILFETRVFGDGPWHEYTRRYSTTGEAKRGHFEIVDAINAGKTPEDLE
jgi:hypothetical protein